MFLDFKDKMEKYAEVVLKVGLNLQPNQRLFIRSSYKFGVNIELVPFIRIIVEKAYKMGARFVEVIWDDEELHRIRYENAPRDSFEEFPHWRNNLVTKYLKNGDALLSIPSEDPDLLLDQDQDLVSQVQRARLESAKEYVPLVSSGASNWCICTAPSSGWAKKLFPNDTPQQRLEKFWDVLFKICRIDSENPVAAWTNHFDKLKHRLSYLNNKSFSSLKLTAPGTDLTIGLPDNHIWKGGPWESLNHITFTPNIPTEEVFTIPHKDKTEGKVTTSKPLYYGGTLIDEFTLKFSKGKVAEVISEKYKSILEKFINMDEGSNSLGEVALVANSSPISQTGMLFYNTLIDENASCHIALGNGIKPCIKDSNKMNDEAYAAAGGNSSMIHIDFMIGSEHMNIKGVTNDGEEETIMINGEWALMI